MESGRKISKMLGMAGIGLFVIFFALVTVSTVDASTVQGVEMIGQLQADDSLLRNPGRLAYAGGTLYVVDSYKNRIQTFDSKGSYAGMISFPRPSAVAAGINGTIYIGSNKDYSVAIYKNGIVTGYLGEGVNEFWSIADISVDGVTGNIYVVDNVGNAVMVYNASGSQVMVITGLNIPRAVEIVGDKIYILDSPIVKTGESISTTVPRVSIYDMSGNQLDSFNAYGDPEERLASPTDLSVAGGNIFISDAFYRTVLVYDSTGTYVGTVSNSGGEINTAVSLVVSPDGIMYVSSSETHSVQVFELDTESGVTAGADEVGGSL